MPRNYRVDHDSEQQHPPGHDTADQAKQKVHSTEHAGATVESSSPIHYGHKFAQTQEILHKRAVEHQAKEHEAAEHKAQEVAHTSTAPIGAVGTEAALPPEAVEPSLMSLWSDAQKSIEQVIHAAREAREASIKLARLPWIAGRVVLHDLEGRLGFSRN
jgi:hypothetical protein